MRELAPGIRHWKATHPNLGMDVSSYWIPELRLLLDPIAVPDEVDDGAIRYGAELQFVPDNLMDDPEKDKAALKSAFAKLSDELDFDVLLLAHGDPYASGGREALRRFSES